MQQRVGGCYTNVTFAASLALVRAVSFCGSRCRHATAALRTYNQASRLFLQRTSDPREWRRRRQRILYGAHAMWGRAFPPAGGQLVLQ
jgi:hypothetical protein